MEGMVAKTDFRLTYANKKVFLTGHTGFKGSWLLYWLELLGAKVKGYSLAPEPDGFYQLIQGDSRCQSVVADIRDAARLQRELLAFQPDFIFHLAAQPLVRLSYEIPTETFEVNALGTAYLLNAVRQLFNPCVVVLITTDKVYENKEWHYPYRESDRLGGYDPYSASKAMAELVISSYRNSYFNPSNYATHQKTIASARAGNVIGGGDFAKDRIIPDIVRALQAGVAITVRNPDAVRPWQHVLEPLGGYLLLGDTLAKNPTTTDAAWNFGPYMADCLTVRELVEASITAWESGTYYVPERGGQPHEAGLLKLDISKAQSQLGWQPYYNSRQAIQLTIDWFKQAMVAPDRVADFTKSQIEAYMQV